MGHTYGQNPLSTAIGAAVLRYIQDNDLVERSEEMGDYLNERLHSLSDFDMVGDIRGPGLFAGIELARDKQSRQWFDPRLKVNIQVANQAFTGAAEASTASRAITFFSHLRFPFPDPDR
ncbi:MAG: aminotransferase class III-fold pyridoxal phosphate-dependent enzyme [Desulfobacterales bacterium]|jgi:adenosylmethionine-8-amino-7-oxononanoate aminotransferase